MATVIQQNLADAGIEMEIVIVDSPTWLDKVWFGVDCTTADWPASRCFNGTHKEFDLGDAWYTREPDPDGLMQSLFRADNDRSGFKGNNGMRYLVKILKYYLIKVNLLLIEQFVPKLIMIL